MHTFATFLSTHWWIGVYLFLLGLGIEYYYTEHLGDKSPCLKIDENEFKITALVAILGGIFIGISLISHHALALIPLVPWHALWRAAVYGVIFLANHRVAIVVIGFVLLLGGALLKRDIMKVSFESEVRTGGEDVRRRSFKVRSDTLFTAAEVCLVLLGLSLLPLLAR